MLGTYQSRCSEACVLRPVLVSWISGLFFPLLSTKAVLGDMVVDIDMVVYIAAPGDGYGYPLIPYQRNRDNQQNKLRTSCCLYIQSKNILPRRSYRVVACGVGESCFCGEINRGERLSLLADSGVLSTQPKDLRTATQQMSSYPEIDNLRPSLAFGLKEAQRSTVNTLLAHPLRSITIEGRNRDDTPCTCSSTSSERSHTQILRGLRFNFALSSIDGNEDWAKQSRIR